jgi:uncharacterized protein (TIGR02147 family)
MSTALPSVFQFEDYRAFLLAHYEARKAVRKQFSYRFMAGRLDVDAGQLAWILKGKLHLPVRSISVAIRMCQLDGRAAAYFEELSRLARAKSNGERARCRERLAAMRGVDSRPVEPCQASFYGQFHLSVLRALAPLQRGATASQLGALCIPPLESEVAERSLETLRSLGLLQGTKDGWKLPDPHIVAGNAIDPAVLRSFHSQAIAQAMQALQTQRPADRDISTITVAFRTADLRIVREWLADARRQIQKLAQDTEAPDRVVQFNAQLFPVAYRPPARHQAA